MLWIISISFLIAGFQRDDQKEVVIDTQNHLMWQDNSEVKNNKQPWSKAIKYCQNLKFAGFDDWRLPTFNELYSLSDFGRFDPAIDTNFKNVVSNYYWSSTTVAGNSSLAWVVNFKYGYDYWYYKANSNYVRCVRGQYFDDSTMKNEEFEKIMSTPKKEITFEVLEVIAGASQCSDITNKECVSRSKNIRVKTKQKNVKWLKIYRTGEPYKDITEQSSFDIELERGHNAIEIKAIGNDGSIVTKRFTVKYENRVQKGGLIWKLIDEAKLNTRELYDRYIKKPKKWALVIGIDDYSEEKNGFERLPFAVNDAKKVRENLKDEFGFSDERILPIFNKKATKENIIDSLDILLRKADEGDDLFIFFSGHGIRKGNLVYLVPVDVEKGYRKHRTSIDIKSDILNYIKIDGKKFRHVLLAFDSCYSGNIAGTFSKGSSNDEKHLPSYVLEKMYHKGFHILTAGSKDEQAFMGGEWQDHSAFTYYFLKGIGGDADKKGDGAVTLYELIDYLEENVRNTVEQTPCLVEVGGNNKGEFVFLKKRSE